MTQEFADKEAERRTKTQNSFGIRVVKSIKVELSRERTVPFISDSTICFEMPTFGAVMNFAIKKRYVPASQRYDELPKSLLAEAVAEAGEGRVRLAVRSGRS